MIKLAPEIVGKKVKYAPHVSEPDLIGVIQEVTYPNMVLCHWDDGEDIWDDKRDLLGVNE